MLNTHSIYHKESALLWQLLGFLNKPSPSIWFKVAKISSQSCHFIISAEVPKMIKDFSVELEDVSISEKLFFTHLCPDFSDCCVANGLSAPGPKAITTSWLSAFTFLETGARPQKRGPCLDWAHSTSGFQTLQKPIHVPAQLFSSYLQIHLFTLKRKAPQFIKIGNLEAIL